MKLTVAHHSIILKGAVLSLCSILVTNTALGQSGETTSEERSAMIVDLQNLDPSMKQDQSRQWAPLGFLKKADTSSDGFLTHSELNTALELRFTQIDRNEDSAVSAADAPRFVGRDRFMSRVRPLIEARDTNADEALDISEFSAPALSQFATLDEDDDNRIDLNALEATLKGEEASNIL